MQFKSMFAAGAMALVFASAAQAAPVTPDNLQGWFAADVTATGAVAITGDYQPAGETGSLEFSSLNGAGKANYVNLLGGANPTLGSLINGGALSFDYLIDSNTSGQPVSPALRLGFQTASGGLGYLVWESTYNGAPLTQDVWHSANILDGNFWMRAFNPGGVTIEKFDVSLAEWAAGYNSGNAKQHLIGLDTMIRSIEVGVGSGWNGEFHGAVDHVNVSFANGPALNSNFEVSAVPEPATWAMMIAGFGLAGAALRRRKVAVAA